MSDTEIRWDDAAAAAIIGARVVIGLTFVGKGAARQEQRHGTVRRAQRGDVIEIALAGAHAGEVFTLPPDTAVFHPAAPGEYRLRSTGEVVTDPDYTVTYTVHESTEG